MLGHPNSPGLSSGHQQLTVVAYPLGVRKKPWLAEISLVSMELSGKIIHFSCIFQHAVMKLSATSVMVPPVSPGLAERRCHKWGTPVWEWWGSPPRGGLLTGRPHTKCPRGRTGGLQWLQVGLGVFSKMFSHFIGTMRSWVEHLKKK